MSEPTEKVEQSVEPELTENEQRDRDVFNEYSTEYENSQQQPEEQQPEVAKVETREVLAPIIHTAFQILCPNWDVKEKESGQLATVWGAVLDKYFPDGVMNEFGLEIAAISTTAMVVLPRLKKPRKTEEKPVNEEPKKEPVNEVMANAKPESYTAEVVV